ncbi:MAG: ABC transporter permease [Anaerolineae bacterium]|nr:ABC transporter permease [Anaerolineae bacterium]
MDVVWAGLKEGLRLLFAGDPYLWEIVLLSAQVSGIALTISALLGIPFGAIIGLTHFPGRRFVQALVYTGMGFPPVVVGLAVYLLLSRNGILGPLNWAWIPQLFTVPAMVLAQVIIATPLVIGYTMAAVSEVDPNLRLQLRALGATPRQATWAVLREARLGVIVALVGGLGSIVSEVGAVTMVGGNIEHATRVLTTAIMLETRRGNMDLAIGLGMVLLALAFMVNLLMAQFQGRGK